MCKQNFRVIIRKFLHKKLRKFDYWLDKIDLCAKILV